MLIFVPVASFFLKKHQTKNKGKKLNIDINLKFILSTFTKSGATGTPGNL